mgnify:CR=1 FL=1
MHQPPLILIADDEAHILHIVSLKLCNAGYAVLTAEDGDEAKALVDAHRPDLIITDLQMPFLNGLELCIALQADPQTAAIPAILLTARGSTLEPQELELTNIQSVMSKPFSPREVLALVGTLLTPEGDPVA